MTYLSRILARRKVFIEAKKGVLPLEELQKSALQRSDIRDFAHAVERGAPAVIAEFKRASPSAGILSREADPRASALAYARGGAAAISVLTEQEHFRGGFDDLKAARRAVALPVLCKDFVVDAYQVWEAVAEGADAVLLIVAALSEPVLRELIALASALGVTPLVEVHDEAEADRGVRCGARVFGINNRDLHSFDVDVETAIRVRRALPASALAIGESGYRAHEQVSAAFRAGIAGVLVGEAFMRDRDPASAVARLRSGAL
jgi:indole-3-glycerol phosphate synthase